MAELCSKCGANLAVVGRVHRCVPREKLKTTKPRIGISGGYQPEGGGQKPDAPTTGSGVMSPKEAYNQFMRDYMRKWRAERRAKG